MIPSSPVNGEVATVVPNRILLFRSPAPDASLPAGTVWADVDGGRRIFGAEYYADLLCELGVSAVASLDCCDYDLRPFTRRDMEHVALAGPTNPAADSLLGPGAGSGGGGKALSLAATARLLALLDGDGGDGAVAVHFEPDAAGGVWRGLMAACLVRRRYFDARAAVAWLHLVWPPAPTDAATAPASAAPSD